MTILEEAIQAVTGPRAEAYGDFKENMERIASIASALLGEEVTARECVMILLAVKFGRLIHTPNHRDSIVDIAGYAEGLARVLGLDNGPERLELEVREVIRAPKCPNCASTNVIPVHGSLTLSFGARAYKCRTCDHNFKA